MVKGSKPTFHSYYDSGVYRYPICSGKERTKHPTQKPIKLMRDLVLKHTNENDVVLDTFMGSGSTGKACMYENKERGANYYFIGVEMTEEYLPICFARIDYAMKDETVEVVETKKEDTTEKKTVTIGSLW